MFPRITAFMVAILNPWITGISFSTRSGATRSFVKRTTATMVPFRYAPPSARTVRTRFSVDEAPVGNDVEAVAGAGFERVLDVEHSRHLPHRGNDHVPVLLLNPVESRPHVSHEARDHRNRLDEACA